VPATCLSKPTESKGTSNGPQALSQISDQIKVTAKKLTLPLGSLTLTLTLTLTLALK
jgi:hypothetical protein